MIYECEKCNAALPAGVLACPKCGEGFDEAVPSDAEVPKRGWQSKAEMSPPNSATDVPTSSTSPPIPLAEKLEGPDRAPILPRDTTTNGWQSKVQQVPKTFPRKPLLFAAGAIIICLIGFALYSLTVNSPNSFVGEYSTVEGGEPLVQVTSTNGEFFIAFERDGVPFDRGTAIPATEDELKALGGSTLNVKSALKMPGTNFIIFQVDKGTQVLGMNFTTGFGSIGGPYPTGLVPSNNPYSSELESLYKLR